jgi:ketosteroid isomerase-like protein
MGNPPGSANPEEIVRRACGAFAERDETTLRGFCHGSLELRPVDALGLVGDTVHGFDAACDRVRRGDARGCHVTMWVQTLERVRGDSVLGVGVVAERGRGCAATVAWVWHVRDGRIDSVVGYPNEAAARRSFRDAA